MSIPLVNSIASWFLKKRFHQIDLFLKYPNEVQNELLQDLLTTAKDTEIGKLYDFASITDYKTFADRIPIFFGPHRSNGLQNLVVRRMPKVNLFL